MALLEVCKQEPGLAHGTLLEFLKDEDSNKVTRAAKTVAAIGADEGLLQVLGTFGLVLAVCYFLVHFLAVAHKSLDSTRN